MKKLLITLCTITALHASAALADDIYCSPKITCSDTSLQSCASNPVNAQFVINEMISSQTVSVADYTFDYALKIANNQVARCVYKYTDGSNIVTDGVEQYLPDLKASRNMWASSGADYQCTLSGGYIGNPLFCPFINQ
jgi:hypothetical protein